MADHQQQQNRIHPVRHDVESPPPPPTVPLMPKHSSRSDESSPQRIFPPQHSKPPHRRKSRSCLCKCICWTISLIVILIILIGIAIGILYLAFRPKLPNYSVDRMGITQFNLTNDNSLQAGLNVTITATNPNRGIGIHYESGSHISVWYRETNLCQGSIPRFYQGHRNTTVMNVVLTGETSNAQNLVSSVQEQVRSTGNVPLNLRVDQPVRVEIGKLKLMKVKFLVRCRLVVDDLSAGDSIRIQQSDCDFKFRL